MTLKRLGTLLFKPAARYPADPRAVFILALSVFSGMTALLLDEAPGSLEQALPGWVVLGWGILLSLGSAVTLLGMSRQSVNGIIIEQVGSITVAAATLFYSGIVFMQVGPSALQGVGIICAWGLSCILRWFQLQALINSAIGRAQKRAVLDALEAQLAARAARERANKRFHVDGDDHLGRWGA
jgi:hypothetical protein